MKSFHQADKKCYNIFTLFSKLFSSQRFLGGLIIRDPGLGYIIGWWSNNHRGVGVGVGAYNREVSLQLR